MRNGLTVDQLNNVVVIIREKVGDPEGDNAAAVLRGLLAANGGVNKAAAGNSNIVGVVSVKMMVTPDSLFNTQMGAVTFPVPEQIGITILPVRYWLSPMVRLTTRKEENPD